MAFYRLYGKWFHLEDSDYFEHVVKAASPRAALYRAVRCLSGAERIAGVDWVSERPRAVQLGQLDPQAAFWVGDEWIYEVRSITRVKPSEIRCPKCKGTGAIQGYVEVSGPLA